MTSLLETLARRWKEARSNKRARELVRRQRSSGDWPEVSAAFERLRAAGVSDSTSMVRVTAVLARETARVMKERRPFDRNAYVRDLDALS